MSPALTATTWERTMRYYMKHGTKATEVLAGILLEIINETDDPKVAEILDAYGLSLLDSNQYIEGET